MRHRHELLHAGAILLVLGCTGTALGQMTTERVAVGLDRPVYATAPTGDTERLFIVEQSGRVRILRNGSLLLDPFLDLSDLTNASGEQGLLGLAFAPDYALSGFFFVYFTDLAGDSQLMRFAVSIGDPDLADPDSGSELLTIDQPFSNHNGGNIAFSPLDGMLYIGLGDGGAGGDPGDRAQNPQELLGKMLRIDVSDPQGTYTVPTDNPFVDDPDTRDEIWALGLRNPYRFAFDTLNSDLYIADVGQSAWEEVDFQPAGSSGGENYGWRVMEGNHCFNPPNDCEQTGLTLPIHEYDHDDGCSITGGFVYRGQAIASLAGRYLFGDYCSERIWSLRVVDGVATDLQDVTAQLAPTESGQTIDAIVGFGQDGNGELYIIDRQGSLGEIYKIVPSGSVGIPPTAPVHLNLGPNYPNPFNPTTTIPFELDRSALVQLAVYGADGRLVKVLVAAGHNPGAHTVVWDGRDATGRVVSAGTYFYRLTSGPQQRAGRMVLLK